MTLEWMKWHLNDRMTSEWMECHRNDEMRLEWVEWHRNEWNDIGMNGMTSEWMERHRNEWNNIRFLFLFNVHLPISLSVQCAPSDFSFCSMFTVQCSWSHSVLLYMTWYYWYMTEIWLIYDWYMADIWLMYGRYMTHIWCWCPLGIPPHGLENLCGLAALQR